MILKDKYNRIHDYLRISITDKCNLNCIYCNPAIPTFESLEKTIILNFEEIYRIIYIFVKYFEFKKIRLTGGEPFARKNVEKLIKKISEMKVFYPFELSATTNGTLIKGNLQNFVSNGLNRLNFSLDTLNREKFKVITGSDKLETTLNALRNAELIGLENIKINTVVMNGFNTNEILDFIEFVKERNLTVRFIEYMPFSNNLYEQSKYIPNSEIKKIIEENYELEDYAKNIVNSTKFSSVSKDFLLKGYTGKVSFISSMSEHFCYECNRIRITSEGKLKLCLFSGTKDLLDLKIMMNEGYDDEHIAASILNHLQKKEEFHADLKHLITLKNNKMISIGG